MTYIHHIDRTTGAPSRVVRASVPAARLEVAADALARALAVDELEPGATAAIGRGSLRLGTSATGRCLLAVIECRGRHEARIGVAGHQRCGRKLWNLLEIHPLCPLFGDRPQAPWCALQISAQAGHRDYVRELAPAIAWAWLDRIRERAEA